MIPDSHFMHLISKALHKTFHFSAANYNGLVATLNLFKKLLLQLFVQLLPDFR